MERKRKKERIKKQMERKRKKERSEHRTIQRLGTLGGTVAARGGNTLISRMLELLLQKNRGSP